MTLVDGMAVAPQDLPAGSIHIADGAVAKLAAYIAGDVPEVGRPTRGIGRLPGGGVVGAGKADLNRRPAVSAHVDGNHVSIDVVASVRWPASVPETTQRLRQQLRERLTELTGLQVDEIHVDITDLITPSNPSARVS